MTYGGLDTIVGVLKAKGLTNLIFKVLGVVFSSDYIITSATEILMGIVMMKIRLVKRT